MWARLAVLLTTLGMLGAALLYTVGLRLFAPASRWVDQAPADALALVVVREMPGDLAFLANSRLGEWFDQEGLNRAGANLDERDLRLLGQLRERLNGGWLALHRVERKANGALRPHLTGLLRPTAGTDDLQTWLEARIAERFGSARITELSDGARLVEGDEPGQTLYMRRRGDDLLLSNSTDSWLHIQTGTSPVNRPVQAELIEALAEPDEAWDLLVYFRGPAPLDVVPTFLYRLNFDRPDQDDYRPLGGDGRTRQIGW